MQEYNAMDNAQLTTIFAGIGKEHRYSDVSAKFTTFKDMKLKWTRSYSWIRFDVSDYLMNAPKEVVRDIAETTFERIGGKQASYPDTVSAYLSSEDFARMNQPIYLRRCRGLKGTEGNFHDLKDSYRRLVEAGLIEEDKDVYIGWNSDKGHNAHVMSTLMKVVTINPKLDCAAADEDMVDYALYMGLSFISLGFNPGNDPEREEKFRELRNRFPNWEKVADDIRSFNLEI